MYKYGDEKGIYSGQQKKKKKNYVKFLNQRREQVKTNRINFHEFKRTIN